MPPKKPQPSVTQNVSGDNNIVIGGDVNGNVIVGDNNTVNQTIIQKFFNIFKSDAETLEQRNRRIMLSHVENFWVKGILEKSLHGAALLELGIKEDPDALTYPWAIKRESTKETLPAGMSMLEIFQEIGMGRSLLILGAPGSGKTTMLLELTRQLIQCAREDITAPIPVVFNLSSWTDRLTLVEWLTKEWDIFYHIEKKIAEIWIKQNKMLLLLDGLDEMEEKSREKCIVAINQFRKQNGLTSITLCSRVEEYAKLEIKLSFDGAIQIQPLTASQVDEYFIRFGEELAGIHQLLARDIVLREMAETPLFLSIMTLAYHNVKTSDILIFGNLYDQRKHLFDMYIQQMFNRVARTQNKSYTSEQVNHWLAWLANTMSDRGKTVFLPEDLDWKWLQNTQKILYFSFCGISVGYLSGLLVGSFTNFFIGLLWGSMSGVIWMLGLFSETIKTWNRRPAIGIVTICSLGGALVFGWLFAYTGGIFWGRIEILLGALVGSLVIATSLGSLGLVLGLPWAINILFDFEYYGSYYELVKRFLKALLGAPILGLLAGIFWGFSIGTITSVIRVFHYYFLRFILWLYGNFPHNHTEFLDFATERIFLRRVGGGYIFVHRLLMEHFAKMYQEEPM